MNRSQNPKRKPGQNRPAAFAFLIQGPPLWSFTQESLEKAKPSARSVGSSPHLQRVQHSRFFGASPVASALDLRIERDLDVIGSTLSRLARSYERKSTLAVASRDEVKQPCLGSVPLAGFETSTIGRFCGGHRGQAVFATCNIRRVRKRLRKILTRCTTSGSLCPLGH